MAQSSYPFDGLPTTETEFSLMFSEMQESGVAGDGNELRVSADASGLNVKVQPGMAFVRGHVYRSTGIETLDIDPGDGQPRIDTVALRLDPTANSITLVVIKGTPAATPAPPPRQRTESGVYEFPLADVAVPANAVTIQSANLTDVRRRTGHRVHTWTTALRPLTPRAGMVGFNTTRSRWEWYNGTAWVDMLAWASIPDRPTTSTLDGRTIFVNDSAPTNAQGANGDVWFEF